MKARFGTNPPTTGRITVKSTEKSIAANFKRKQKQQDKKNAPPQK